VWILRNIFGIIVFTTYQSICKYCSLTLSRKAFKHFKSNNFLTVILRYNNVNNFSNVLIPSHPFFTNCNLWKKGKTDKHYFTQSYKKNLVVKYLDGTFTQFIFKCNSVMNKIIKFQRSEETICFRKYFYHWVVVLHPSDKRTWFVNVPKLE
jgi:hypothetical protein